MNQPVACGQNISLCSGRYHTFCSIQPVSLKMCSAKMNVILCAVFHVLFLATCSGEPSVFITMPPNVIVGEENIIGVWTTSDASNITMRTSIPQLSDEILHEETHVIQRTGDQYGVTIAYHPNFIPMTSSPQEVTFDFTVNFCSDTTCSVITKRQLTQIVRFIHRPIIVLGETDKPLYRPSDTVRFRFIAVTTQLISPSNKPASYPRRKLIQLSDGSLQLVDVTTEKDDNYRIQFHEISVKDSAGNRVKVWRNITPLTATKLNYTLLPDSPEGEWTITATVMDTVENLRFMVRHYVLPRFVIAIHTPTGLSLESTYAQFSVCSNYSNGPPMQGFVRAHLCVCSKPRDESAEENTKQAILDGGMCSAEAYSNKPRPCAIAQLVVDDTGCALFNVSTQPLGLNKPEYSQWNQVAVVCANVEEDGTKSNVADCKIGKELMRRADEPKLEIQSVYKVGLPITGFLTAPKLSNARLKFVVSEQPEGCGWGFRHGSRVSITKHLHSALLTLNETGAANFLIPPLDSTKSVVIKFTHTDVNQSDRIITEKIAPGLRYIRPVDDSVVASEVLRPWRDIQSVVMQLWPTEGSVQYACPGEVSFQVIANTQLADKVFHIQSNVRGKILTHVIPAISKGSEPCIDVDGELGHYRCLNPTGDRIECLQGWTGANCLKPVCAAECHPRGGTCNVPNGCICLEGWSGSNCDHCAPLEGCKHGTCVNGNDCECDAGWGGYLCDRKLVEYERIPEVDESETSRMYATESSEPSEFDTVSTDLPVRTLFTRQIQFNLTGDWGPDATVVVYFYQNSESGQVVVPTVVKLENMYQCISRSVAELVESGKKGMQFDASRVSPGQDVQLVIAPTGIGRVPYNTTDETEGLCFVRISDVSLKNFDQGENAIDRLSVANRMQQLTTSGSRTSPMLTNSMEAFQSAGLLISSSTIMDVIEPSIPMCYFTAELNEPLPMKSHFPSNSFKKKEGDLTKLSDTQSMKSKMWLRSFFPEVWKFEVYKLNSPNIIKQFTAPDTITTWIASAFCTTQSNGLWIPNVETLTVSMPFYVDITLPVHVKRGEILYLPVSVFMEADIGDSQKCLEAQVQTTVDANEWLRVGTSSYTGCVCESQKVTFQLGLLPIQLGKLNVTVEAQATVGSQLCNQEIDPVVQKEDEVKVHVLSDIIQRQIRVIPEGIPQELAIGGILHIQPNESATKQTFPISLPSKIVSDSLRIYVSYSDDILGPALNHLDSLIRLPLGCGEQNMVLVAPSVYALDYLTSMHSANTDRTLSLVNQARNYILMGYQRQLNYRLSDGSYSAFGKSDKIGSTWLTAFVLRVFAKAHKVDSSISIDWAVFFNETIAFLKQRQNLTGSGCFVEKGRVIHTAMQGGTGNQLDLSPEQLLTAYVLTALVETKPQGEEEAYSPELSQMIQAGMKCLKVGRLGEMTSSDQLQNVSTYGLMQLALALAFCEPQNPLMSVVASEIIKRRLSNSVRSGTYWTSDGKKIIGEAGALDIETTSYAYLALAKMGVQFSDLFSIVRWLSSQQSATGGFRSTQDTILALEVISDGAKRLGLNQSAISEPQELTVLATILPANISVSSTLTETKMNVVHRFSVVKMIPADVKYVEWAVSSNGTSQGTYLSVQTELFYNVPDRHEVENASFVLVTSVVQGAFPQKDACKLANITICLRLPDIDSNPQPTGMLLIEIGMVSGWSPVREELLRLIVNEGESMRSVEIGGDGTVSLFFNGFTSEEVRTIGLNKRSTSKRCATVPLKQDLYVKNSQPAEVVAKDYYAPDQSVAVNYSLYDCESVWFTPGDLQPPSDKTEYPTSTLTTPVPSTSMHRNCPACVIKAEENESLVEQFYQGLCKGYNNVFLFSVHSGSGDEYNVTISSFDSSTHVASWNATLNLADCSCPVVTTSKHLMMFSPEDFDFYPGDAEVSIRSTRSFAIVSSVQELFPYVKGAFDMWKYNTTVNETTDAAFPWMINGWNCKRIQTVYRYIVAKML
ncbi:unnamed protein product [Dicrocoelium dendriticum]|nr:unnamed protein product [Dicrocoelium dendriticum]